MDTYLGIFSTHPIQYQVPLWRKLAARKNLRIHVYYGSDSSVRGEIDREFGVPVKWDVPLLEGYDYSFLKNTAKNPGPEKGFWGINCPEIESIMQKEKFDAVLVHCYSHFFEWQVMWAAWRNKVSIMLRGDNREGTGIKKSPFFEFVRSTVLRQLYKRISICLAVGKYMRRHFLKHGVAEWRVVNCPHCVDTDLMREQRDRLLPKKFELRGEVGIPPEALVLLFSGKLVPRKNPLLLARALRLVKSRERIWVLVAGDGVLRERLEAELKEVLGNRVVFPGFVNQSELGKYYAISDVLVLPSSWGETWGLVVNEAMLFGLPALVTDTVGCREDLVIPGRTGYIYPCDNEEALAGIVQDLIDNPELIRKLGTAAQEHIKAYSADAAVEGIVEGLRRLKLL